MFLALSLDKFCQQSGFFIGEKIDIIEEKAKGNGGK